MEEYHDGGADLRRAISPAWGHGLEGKERGKREGIMGSYRGCSGRGLMLLIARNHGAKITAENAVNEVGDGIEHDDVIDDVIIFFLFFCFLLWILIYSSKSSQTNL